MGANMKQAIAVVLVSILLMSCGGYTETIQKAEKSYLKFVGNTTAIMITIDDGAPFAYNPEIELYQVKPGKRQVKIVRNNQIIVNRTITLDNQTTFEIPVP
jgi:hypothetical protein